MINTRCSLSQITVLILRRRSQGITGRLYTNVLTRSSGEKAFALHFGIDKLQENHSQDIDAICVFDADNAAAPDFLVEMNHALCSGGM